MQEKLHVSNRKEYATEGMRLDFAELTVSRFKHGESDIFGIPSIADQLAIGAVEVAEVEKVALSGGGSVHEETRKIVEPDLIFKHNDKEWDLEGIMTSEEVEASVLRGKMRALQEKCCFASVKVPAEILAVIALAERRLDLER